MGLMKLYAITFEEGEKIEGTRYVAAPELAAAACSYRGSRMERVELLGHIDVVNCTGVTFVRALKQLVEMDDNSVHQAKIVAPPHPRGD